MPFPEFDPDKRKILFFSRGRGRGHALPDMEIVKELHKLRDDVEVRFVSYGTGARAIEEGGHRLIDVDLPEEGAAAEMTALAGKLIAWLKPDIVVSHEEFPVAPAAKIFDCATVFITEWFTEHDSYSMHALKFADRILFIENQSLFPEPTFLKGRVEYLGRLLRELEYGSTDRERARRELGLPSGAMVVAVIPGGYATEERAPLADLLIPAFDALPEESRFLFWVAGQSLEALSTRLAGRSDARVEESLHPIDQLMAAADVVVTKANRGTALEARALGRSVVAVTQGDNPIDDAALAAEDGVLFLHRNQVRPNELAEAITKQARECVFPDLRGRTVPGAAAAKIAEQLERTLEVRQVAKE